MKALILKENSVIKKILLTLLFLGISLGLPQTLHFMPIGNLGRVLLPINFSVILASMILGVPTGLFLGIASPLFSHLFFGMPTMMILPILMTECIFFGVISGYLKNKIPNKFVVVILTLVLGLAMSFLVLFIGQIYFTNPNVMLLAGLVKSGVPGMVLQILLIPILVDKLNNYIK